MIRNLKALGLALVAVFAMSAMAAVGAQAESVAHFEIGKGTVKLDTKAETSQTYVLGGKTVVCTEVEGTAAVTEETIPTEITSNTDVNYKTCHTTALGLSFPTTVTQETNCHYTFTAGTFTKDGGEDGKGSAHGTVHICESTIDIFNSPHPGGSMRCQIHVPKQTVEITYTNVTTEGKMAVTIDVVNQPITSTVTDFNTLGCNTHEHGSATYNGNIWVKGTDAAGAYSDVTVKGTP